METTSEIGENFDRCDCYVHPDYRHEVIDEYDDTEKTSPVNIIAFDFDENGVIKSTEHEEIADTKICKMRCNICGSLFIARIII